MSKGGGGGSGGDSNQLAGIIKDLSGETKPIRDVLSSQFLEALQTGGIGARIPIIGAAQDQSRAGTARALTGTQDQLTRMGLGRTPFAANTLAQTRMQGDMATSMIPSQIAQGFIGSAPQYAMAPVGAMVSGAGNINTNASNRDIAKGNQSTQLMVGLMTAAATAAAASCWIAARLYGEDSIEWSLARWYIFVQWDHPIAPVVRWTYRRWGRSIARSRFACELLRPLFDAAVRRGRAALIVT